MKHAARLSRRGTRITAAAREMAAADNSRHNSNHRYSTVVLESHRNSLKRPLPEASKCSTQNKIEAQQRRQRVPKKIVFGPS
jgi:hypothetical protein